MPQRSRWFRAALKLVMAAIVAGLAPMPTHAGNTATIEYHELTEPLDSEAAASLGVKLAPTDHIRRSKMPLVKTRYWMYQIAPQSQKCDLEPCRVLIRDIKEGRTILDLYAKGKIKATGYSMEDGKSVGAIKFETLCGELIALLSLADDPRQYLSINERTVQTRPLSEFNCDRN